MKTKYVNRDWLEGKVNEINHELMNFHHEAKERQRLEAARNYYVSKLIDMDEKGLNLIKIDYERKSNS